MVYLSPSLHPSSRTRLCFLFKRTGLCDAWLVFSPWLLLKVICIHSRKSKTGEGPFRHCGGSGLGSGLHGLIVEIDIFPVVSWKQTQSLAILFCRHLDWWVSTVGIWSLPQIDFCTLLFPLSYADFIWGHWLLEKPCAKHFTKRKKVYWNRTRWSQITYSNLGDERWHQRWPEITAMI